MNRDEILNLPAGRELDALIAELVMGEKKPVYSHSHPIVTQTKWSTTMSWYCSPEYEKGDVCEWIPKPYSTDMTAAWEVVDRFDRTHWDITIYSYTDSEPIIWEVAMYEFFEDSAGRCGKAEADTAPLTICRAALLAVLDD